MCINSCKFWELAVSKKGTISSNCKPWAMYYLTVYKLKAWFFRISKTAATACSTIICAEAGGSSKE